MAASSFIIPVSYDENLYGTPSGAEHNPIWEPRVSEVLFDKLDDPSFRLLQPLKVRFERGDFFGCTASFPPANFAVSGTSKHDAYQALEVELLDAFDDWTADESMLGPGPRQQLAVLKQYIAKC